MPVDRVARGTDGHKGFDGHRILGLRSKVKRPPTVSIGRVRVGATGQQRLQTLHITINDGRVHRRPPQPIPIRHTIHPRSA